MDIASSFQLIISFRLLLAFAAGMLIGFDRERSGKVAGLRTKMLVCVGSALFAGLSVFVARGLGLLDQDPTRIMAQIVSGVGFLGAGVILKNGNRLSGVTTAATIWTTAAVGVAIGSGFYLPAGITVLLILMLNPMAHLQYKYGFKGYLYHLNIHKKGFDTCRDIFVQLHIRLLQKAIHGDEIHMAILSTEKKNDKLAELLSADEVKFSLEPGEE